MQAQYYDFITFLQREFNLTLTDDQKHEVIKKYLCQKDPLQADDLGPNPLFPYDSVLIIVANSGRVLKKFNNVAEACHYKINNEVFSEDQIIKNITINYIHPLGIKWVYACECEFNLPGEEWRQIPPAILNTKNIYYISNLGRFRRPDGIQRRLAHDTEHKLYIENKTYRVHQLVMQTFNPTNNKRLIIAHIDKDKTNNDLRNLKWVTKGELSQESARMGSSNGNSTKVYKLSLNDEILETFDTVKQAADYIACSSQTIRNYSDKKTILKKDGVQFRVKYAKDII